MVFNSRFKPIPVEPRPTHVETLSGDYLEYDEKGRVVKFTGLPVNLYEITQSFKEEASLECQLQRLKTLGVDTGLQESACGDARNIPTDVEDLINLKKNTDSLVEQVKSMDIKLEDALKGDINKIVEDYVSRKLKDVKVVSNDADKEVKQ